MQKISITNLYFYHIQFLFSQCNRSRYISLFYFQFYFIGLKALFKLTQKAYIVSLDPIMIATSSNKYFNYVIGKSTWFGLLNKTTQPLKRRRSNSWRRQVSRGEIKSRKSEKRLPLYRNLNSFNGIRFWRSSRRIWQCSGL